MEANLMLLVTASVLISTGVYLILDKVLTRILLGIILLGNGANLLLLQAGGPAGSPPILERDSLIHGAQASDPLAQAMILTAIVISMALSAFILALTYRHYRYRTADLIEMDSEDAAIAIAARSYATAENRSGDEDAADAERTVSRPSSRSKPNQPKFFESSSTARKEGDDD